MYLQAAVALPPQLAKLFWPLFVRVRAGVVVRLLGDRNVDFGYLSRIKSPLVESDNLKQVKLPLFFIHIFMIFFFLLLKEYIDDN